MGARIPKATFYAIVEQSYREGIGARRLERLIGYSSVHIRKAARALGMPLLPRHTGDVYPSVKLLAMIGSVEHLRVDDRRPRRAKCRLPVADLLRPDET